MAILEELKAKANGAADQANNIQEAISMMEFGGGGGSSDIFVLHCDEYMQSTEETWDELKAAIQANKIIKLRAKPYPGSGQMAQEFTYGWSEFIQNSFTSLEETIFVFYTFEFNQHGFDDGPPTKAKSCSISLYKIGYNPESLTHIGLQNAMSYNATFA